MSLRECQEKVDSREFSLWQAYWQFNPFGEEPRMLAQLCAIVANANGGKGKGKPYTLDEMLPVPRPMPPKPLQDPAETKANLRAALGRFRR